MKNLLCSLILLFMLLFCNIAIAKDITPQDLQKIYIANFSYISDKTQFGSIEYYQSPEDFAETRMGDCDDFGIHTQYVLDYFGYEVQMYTIYFKKGAHIVTTFKQYGYYHVFSNGFIRYTEEIKPLDAVKKLYPKWMTIAKFHPPKYGKINWWNHLMSDTIISFRFFILNKESSND